MLILSLLKVSFQWAASAAAIVASLTTVVPAILLHIHAFLGNRRYEPWFPIILDTVTNNDATSNAEIKRPDFCCSTNVFLILFAAFFSSLATFFFPPLAPSFRPPKHEKKWSLRELTPLRNSVRWRHSSFSYFNGSRIFLFLHLQKPHEWSTLK